MKGRDTDMKRLIVAISGATGVQMGARLLEVLHHMHQVETHLVISRGAEVIFQRETSIDLEELKKLADYTYDVDNLAAAISSGSYRTDGMIILPCSMKTLSGLANAYDEDLIVRAADVCLKENRRVKDVYAAQTVAKQLCLATNETVCICAGLHLDHASQAQIKEMMDNCTQAAQQAAEAYKKMGGQ